MSHAYEYMYLPGQKQCPKCGSVTLTAVGPMPARPLDHVALTCSGCGAYEGVSTVAVSNARAQDIVLWGQL